jgi:hypothetical protein
MRLETSERPSSWQLPWGQLLQLQKGLDNNAHLQRPASSATRQDIGQKYCPSPHLLPGPFPHVARMDTGRMTAPLCLCKRQGQSPTPTLNKVKASWTSWVWWQKTDVALGPQPRVAVQVAGRPQSPTWCYQTSCVSFILHRFLLWGWMVTSTRQKGKTVLFKFKTSYKN